MFIKELLDFGKIVLSCTIMIDLLLKGWSLIDIITGIGFFIQKARLLIRWTGGYFCLYVEVTHEENDSKYEDDPKDSISLLTQPNGHMNGLFYGVCFIKIWIDYFYGVCFMKT